ncbi:MAG: aminotransferase class I/II-fold pyridoxal phosphate-dependent enzyme [Peptococcaceae bacterium]|nr:aminotransferase class I/II-fold pyridoxal phosphate-dependent enzyme [Peptococcaceae bacterium]
MEYYSQKAAETFPYTPGERPERSSIKINTNENPYAPSPEAIAAAREVMGGGRGSRNAAGAAEVSESGRADGAAGTDLRLYPDPESDEVRQAVVEGEREAGGIRLDPENVFVGNGSDDVLSICFQAFFPPVGAEGKALLFPDLSYSFYPVYANLYGVPYRKVPVNERFEIDSRDYMTPNAGILFPNPNAPTGIYKPVSEMESLLEYTLHKSLVVVDEAYIAFVGDAGSYHNHGRVSAASLISRYPNLLVVRTLSKSHALAGLRVGYALGRPHLIEGLTRIKNSINSYPVGILAQKIAAAALQDTAYYAQTTARIVATRERVTQRLTRMGFRVLPSSANFVLAAHAKVAAQDLYQLLGEKGIWVRYFNMPRIDNFIRVSMGTDEEMDIFLERVQRIVEGEA